MKILIILKRWQGGVGGGIKNISVILRKYGHQITTISVENDWGIFSSGKNFLLLRKKYKEIISNENPDVIYTQDWSQALPLLFPFSIYNEKHFCMFHGNQFGKGKVFQNIVGKIMGNRLLCMAPSLKNRFPKATMNYCGVNLEKFKDLNKKRRYLGWIQKGTELNSKEEMKKLSNKTGIPLLIAKKLKYDDMNEKFYNKCKIFVSFPPRVAGFQASWLEAMASGVPIVIGNFNGSGEIQPFDKIPNGKEHDLDLIAKKIKNAEKIDYKKWIKEKDFTWERHTLKLIEIFNKTR